jgi:hypothetical protein
LNLIGGTFENWIDILWLRELIVCLDLNRLLNLGADRVPTSHFNFGLFCWLDLDMSTAAVVVARIVRWQLRIGDHVAVVSVGFDVRVNSF